MERFNESQNNIACLAGEALSDEEKDRLWNEIEFMRRTSSDPQSHFAEFGDLRPQDLSDWEWHVLANWRKLSEKEISDFRDISFAEKPADRPYGTNEKRDPRDSFYALITSLILDREMERRKQDRHFGSESLS